MHYITTVADAVEGMSAYMKKHGKAIPPGAPVRSNINEFYSLAMVALHETRLKADAAFQETIDNTIDLCIDQLVGIGMQPNIPMDIGNQIKARRFLRTAEMAGPPAQPQQHQHQQPQWQRLRSRPDAITTTSTARTPATATSDTSDFGAVIAASTDEAGVTSLAEIRKRMHLARVKKNLDDKQGGPQPTGPK